MEGKLKKEMYQDFTSHIHTHTTSTIVCLNIQSSTSILEDLLALAHSLAGRSLLNTPQHQAELHPHYRFTYGRSADSFLAINEPSIPAGIIREQSLS